MSKKKVMLIGDSIRLLYQDKVAALLADEYDVVWPGENGRFCKYMLNELGRWFAACGEPDIIHWNVGLWDTSVVCKEDGAFTPIPEFLKYVDYTLRELRKKTDKVIFATITPVKPGSPNQKVEYIEEYNRQLIRFMKQNDCPINDLFSLLNPDKETMIGPDCIHISPAGAEICAKAVADSIRAIDR